MSLEKISGGISKVLSIVVGVLFLAGGLLFFFKYDPDAYDMQTTGTVVELEDHYEFIGDEEELVTTAYIDYTVGDKTYEHVEYFEYHTGMKVGDTVEFYYMSSDPSQIAGSDKNAGPYIGLAFAVAGAAVIVFTIIRIVRKK